jgi:hypothetical protein
MRLLLAAVCCLFASTALAQQPPFLLGQGLPVERKSAASPRWFDNYTVGSIVRAQTAAPSWVFGIAAEAWAEPSATEALLVGLEAAVINESPTNMLPKVGLAVVFKTRADGAPPTQGPQNFDSRAIFLSAQTGTGWSRGLVVERGAVAHALIDLSDLGDAACSLPVLRTPKHDILLDCETGALVSRPR